ncbi:threonyl-tRNA synthetase [Mycoplasmopsis canis UFG1]|uniref:Threonine--tRNA ligase n=1 Tax=Mycoplasmopsis canis TaxID=29555 RepID=A0A449AR73_9BACT|nr:threonine--tRNA ligase [Mycoplasmopsis canis]AMD81144.1 threonine--tRNA ligase [Mycoplasmopsis canis PG 14]EIE39791.1 threonyl-tRNA synthetase [Mycoplasmopsis canis PG 14]EIE41577.1 threonyl-tRNA synthetase [Mycoplasmopsis canis UFG1]WQQ12260.1 threonine--tRNA ligase [Mycoplasmopsis canis]VEU68967.1 Threonine--tRNA ligase [Mycoplasmopsis canis]
MKANKELNHTTSHLLGAAIEKLYPNVKLGFGPATDEGFYYDFEFEQPLSDTELSKIEKFMKKLASRNLVMTQVSEENYSFENKPYKKELYDELKAQGKHITFYSLIDPLSKEVIFTDLCAGGHVNDTKHIKHFKLLNLAGAYWRGNSDNIQLTRIYGTSWESANELEEFLNILKDRKERDHRKIGKEMKLFTFNKLGGQGLPFWLEDGMYIHNEIKNLVLKMDRKYGFTEVLTPHFGEEELYVTSGHLAHYKDDMFKPIIVENEKLIPRPMTCPHHILCYNTEKRSYRDLPIRYSEQSQLYRYEKSGALTGLERVRGMLLTEGHLFVRKDQIAQEFKSMYKLIKETLEAFKIKISYVSLSLRDPENKEKYYNDDKMWNEAEDELRKVLNELGVEYEEKVGEAAFYGPKMDIQIFTALGHEITVSTLQLDFLLPQKFNMTFTNKNNEDERPVLIHRGLVGTYERFVAILIEQTKGVLPFWLAPKQITVIPATNNDEDIEYAKEINQKLFELEFRSKVDLREERLSKKIREAQISKSKIQLILGEKERLSKTISYREYGKEETITLSVESFIDFISKLKASKE